MPKVNCEWECTHRNKEGFCECPDEVKLVDFIVASKGSLLDCKNFEFAEEVVGSED